MHVYFEDGPWAGQTKSIDGVGFGRHTVEVAKPLTWEEYDRMFGPPEDVPKIVDKTARFHIYRIVAVNNHPSGCQYKAVVS